MAVEVEELFIQPFQDIVERGRQAIENADDDDDVDRANILAKAGQSIVKEGERALKRVRPLWDKQVGDHGDAFRDAIRKNENLDEKRRKLEDILYDFEDFVETDTFEPEKFDELQLSAKIFALDLIDSLKRMKIERSSPPPCSSLARQKARPRPIRSGSPLPMPPMPPPPLPALLPALLPARGSASRDSASRDPSMAKSRGLEQDPISGSPQHSPQRADSPTLRSPRLSPVDNTRSSFNATPSLSFSSNRSNASVFDRSSTVTSKTSYSGYDVPHPPSSDVWVTQARSASTKSANGEASMGNENRRTTSSTQSSGTPSVIVNPTEPNYNPPWNSTNNGTTTTLGAPAVESPLQLYSNSEDSSLGSTGHVNQILTYTSRVATLPLSATTTTTTTTARSSFGFDPNSPVIRTTSTLPTREFLERPSTSPAIGEHSVSANNQLRLPAPAGSSSTVLPRVDEIERPGTRMTQFSEGHMLSHDASKLQTPMLPAPGRDMHLSIGLKSSVYNFGGFCDGAREIQNGPGPQGIKHTAGYGSGRAVGRCVRCEFNRELAEVQMDFANDSLVNSVMSGVLFRPRFLWKSHLSTRQTSGHIYGCLFCTSLGKVTFEGDATAFPNQAALFRHLSRHPQPLPFVRGVTVLYGKVDKTNPLIEDYDVHLPDSPAPCNMPNPSVLASLPTAMAVKAHTLRPGETRLVDPDGVDALIFYECAKIVGIEFSERFGGKWAYGWHDGVRGAFPVKNVELDLPHRTDFPVQGGRSYTGVVRWKWDPRDKESWLPLEKKETITNIGWVYKDHWCWCGVNSKGNYGIFPSTHINPMSVKEEQIYPVGRSSSRVSGDRSHSKTRNFFGIRRRLSSAGASMSSASTDARDVIEII